MATRGQDFSGIVAFIKQAQSAAERAQAKALIKVALDAEALAKKNAIRQFTGRNDRTLTGGLLNSIYSTVVEEKGSLNAYVGVRGIPYGRIHEFGGVIKPKKAQHLWIPVYKNAGKMTPREFISLLKGNAAFYEILGNTALRWTGGRDARGYKVWTPLFHLVHKVTMPERPYIRPAAAEAFSRFGSIYESMLRSELR